MHEIDTFVLCKWNTSNNKMLKVYNFRMKSGIGKWSFYAAKFEETIIFQHVHLRRELLLRLYPINNSLVCIAQEGRHVRILHEFICIWKDQTNIPKRKRIFTPRNLALNIDKPDVIYQFNICNWTLSFCFYFIKE